MAYAAPVAFSSGQLVTSADLNLIQTNITALRDGEISVTSQAAGDVLFASSATAIGRVAIGTANQVLTSSGSAPQWSTQISNSAMPSNVDLSGSLDVTGASTFDSAARLAAGTTFGADTAAANTLDDYEEGTWTGAAVSVGGTSLSIVNTVYTKVGNKVWFSGALDANSLTTTGGSSYVSGLPFTVANGNPTGAAMKGDYTQAGTVNTPESTDRVYFSTFSSIAGQIRFSGVYTV